MARNLKWDKESAAKTAWSRPWNAVTSAPTPGKILHKSVLSGTPWSDLGCRYEKSRIAEQQQKRQHPMSRLGTASLRNSASAFACPFCNQTFRVRIGLISYLRTHNIQWFEEVCRSKPAKASLVFGTQFKSFWMRTGRHVTVSLTASKLHCQCPETYEKHRQDTSGGQ